MPQLLLNDFAISVVYIEMYIVRNQTWWATRFPENKVLGNSGEREQLPFIYRLVFGGIFVCQFYLLKKNNKWTNIKNHCHPQVWRLKKNVFFFITWPVRTRTDADGPWFVSYIFFFFTIVKYFFLYIWIHCGCKGSFMYLFYKLS